MSATEELRRLLDGRGVEWMDGGDGLTVIPAQDGVPGAWSVNTWPSGKDMGDCLWVESRHPLTPEQAVEATLGRGERRDVTGEDRTQAFTCSDCGCWVAYDEYWETGIYMQSGRQVVHIHPNYCPSCGAKVVGG